jgi:hypothetical protein
MFFAHFSLAQCLANLDVTLGRTHALGLTAYRPTRELGLYFCLYRTYLPAP